MRGTQKRLVTAASCVALASLGLIGAARAEGSDSSRNLDALIKRIEKLEAQNQELKAQLDKVNQIEAQQKRIEDSLAQDTVSENEPELSARLKAVEFQSLGMLKQARQVEALDGITAGVSFTTVMQKPSTPKGVPAGSDLDGKNYNSQLNWRGDAFVTLPLEALGDAEGKLFGQFRIGQGKGLNDINAFSKPNGTAFQAVNLDADNSAAILAQLWYQTTIPLPFGGFKGHSKESMELGFGKMDPFVFFDQNAVANDETKQFLNSVFVHNPLLDAGGDIGVDGNGFTPGIRTSYINQENKNEIWKLSAGVFGAGQGANYSRSFTSPLLIAQAETQKRFGEGLLGNYRVYVWRNGQAAGFDGETVRHSGWGISADQRFGDSTTVFARLSKLMAGSDARFDRSITTGLEIVGNDWGRSADSLGLAFGWLRTTADFRNRSATVDADNNGVADYGYAAANAEKLVELYYRYRVSKQFELSPDLQLINRPAGNPDAGTVRIVGLRAQITY